MSPAVRDVAVGPGHAREVVEELERSIIDLDRLTSPDRASAVPGTPEPPD